MEDGRQAALHRRHILRLLRLLLSLFLVLVGSALTFPASAALWEQRILKDEDRFVALGQDILRQPAVQEQLTERIAAEAFAIEPRLTEAAAASLAGAVVEELPESGLGRDVLERSHVLLRALLEDERIEAAEDSIVLDLRPVVEGLVSSVNVALPPEQRVILPPESGRVVLVQEEDLSLVFLAARLFDRYAPIVALLPLVVFALAVMVAPARLVVLGLCGLGTAVASGIIIALLDGPLASSAVDAALISPSARRAATEAYDVMAASVISQEQVILIAGLGLAILAFTLAVIRRLLPGG